MDTQTVLDIIKMIDNKLSLIPEPVGETDRFTPMHIWLEIERRDCLLEIREHLESFINDQLTDDDYYEKGHCPNCGGLIDLHGPKCAGE